MKNLHRILILLVTVVGAFALSSAPAHANQYYSIPSPPHERLKDFSVVEDNGVWHAFAMSVCTDSLCGHPNSVIWHYISYDLVHWTNLGIVIAPRTGTSEADRDDVWAPTVFRANGQWYMYYTAVQDVTGGPTTSTAQKIAVATSSDLMTWNRTTNNVVFDCSTVSWMYWDPADPNHTWDGAACRDPYVMWDAANNRWLMNVSTRHMVGWNYPMIVGQLWSDDLQTWHDLGSVATTSGGVAESSHIIFLNGQYYLLWTSNSIKWASGPTAQGPFTGVNNVGGNSWGYASEALSIDNQMLFFSVAGYGIVENSLYASNGQLNSQPILLGETVVKTTVSVPGLTADQSPVLKNVPFLLYRDNGDMQWDASTDLYVGSYMSDTNGSVTVGASPGQYWLVPDPNDFSAGNALAKYAPTNYATPITSTWGSQSSASWTASVAGRRWVIDSSETTVSHAVIPATATATASTPFSEIHGISLVGSHVENATLMLSNDNGDTWLTVENGQWVSETLDAEHAATVTDVNAIIDSFPIGDGQLQWQLFLPDNSTVIAFDAALDHGPTTPQMIAPLNGAYVDDPLPTLQMQGGDQDGSSLMYVLQYCNGGVCQSIDSLQTKASWTGLVNGVAPAQTLVNWTSPQYINGSTTWRVRSVDTGGAGMWSDWTDWQNLQTPDAISITFPQTTIVSTTSVILHWATNNPSYIYIWYYDGAGVEHDLSFDSTYTTSGSVTITGLKAGRTSLFYFDAVDSYGQENGDPVLTVKMPTVATTASQIKSGYDGTLCHVSWQTSDSSIGALSYGFTNQLGHTVVETSSGTAHEVTFSCSVGQTIYYQVSGQGATQYTSAITKFLVPSLENVFDQELPLPLPIMRPIPGGSRRM